MGTPNIGDKDPLAVLEGALKGGITAFQLREKGEGARVGAELKELAEQCKALCEEYKVPFIVNDDVDLALEIDADGVHIGQEDGVVSEVRSKIGKDKILGVSTNSLNEALTASDAGANYVGVGPLFDTDSKENAGPAIGTELIKEIVAHLPGLSIVGIGGITERKASQVIHAGASGVAVISAITNGENTEEATRNIKGRITLALTGVEM
jgi:thiamine-phosphate pyrophosphorylase